MPDSAAFYWKIFIDLNRLLAGRKRECGFTNDQQLKIVYTRIAHRKSVTIILVYKKAKRFSAKNRPLIK